MWRITDDFWDDWKVLKAMFYRCELWQDHIEPGCYPDCDMLPLGYLGGGFGKGEWMTRFTHDEQQTMTTLWCLFGSPLMLGAELTKLDNWTLSLLTNREVLAMLTPNCQPRQIWRDEKSAAWTAENKTTGTRYIALFNLSDHKDIICTFIDAVEGRELWTGKTLAIQEGKLAAELRPHACAVYRLNP